MRVLALAPHPDDEVLGAGATLLALRDAGAEVVVGLCGRGSDLSRRADREAEAREASRRAGWELRLGGDVVPLLGEGWDVVVAPQVGDRHPAHERVARAVETCPGAFGRWWAWGLWAELDRPNVLVPFGEHRLAELSEILAAHESEVARLDLPTILRARAELHATLGPERAFGFGGDRALCEPYAEALVELVRAPGEDWRRSPPRVGWCW